ncbi:MAG: hypothetical protein ACE5IW_10995 [bacterium]
MSKNRKRAPNDMKSEKETSSQENLEEERFHFDNVEDDDGDYSEETRYWEQYFDEEDEHFRQREKKKTKKRGRFRDREF